MILKQNVKLYKVYIFLEHTVASGSHIDIQNIKNLYCRCQLGYQKHTRYTATSSEYNTFYNNQIKHTLI